MNSPTLTLDVRDDLRHGRAPFAKITAVAGQLSAGQCLLVIAPFEPLPLVSVLGQQGFVPAARQMASGDWEVLFSLPAAAAPAPGTTTPTAAGGRGPAGASEVIDLDVRGLEPPQPMVMILEALRVLPPLTQLRAHTDRRPVHLYPLLEERGFRAQTEEQFDGTFITQIQPR